MPHAITTSADYIGTGFSGVYGLSRVHFLLVEIPDPTFQQLCQHGTEREDMEENGDTEPECEDEGAQCDDEGADTDSEPDDRRLRRHEYPMANPVTGAHGKWLISAKGRDR